MITEIQNLKLKDIHKLDPETVQEQISLLQYLKPEGSLKEKQAKNIFEMQFAEVENLKRWLSRPSWENLIRAACLVFDLKEQDLMELRLVPFFHAVNHISSQVEHVLNMEKQNLSKKPKQMLIDAGISRLDRFGALNVINRFAQQFGVSPLEVEQWPYSLIYSLQWMQKIESEVQEDYQELMKHKNK